MTCLKYDLQETTSLCDVGMNLRDFADFLHKDRLHVLADLCSLKKIAIYKNRRLPSVGLLRCWTCIPLTIRIDPAKHLHRKCLQYHLFFKMNAIRPLFPFYFISKSNHRYWRWLRFVMGMKKKSSLSFTIFSKLKQYNASNDNW